jgi:magnesium transporter
LISVYVHENGATRPADRVDPAWLDPSATMKLWVDLANPSAEEFSTLSDVFHFHPLSVEDARSSLQYPKVEQYPNYLYLVLHGIDSQANSRGFSTRDIDFFIGRNFLVTVHDGVSRSGCATCVGSMRTCSAKGPCPCATGSSISWWTTTAR